MRSVTRCPPTHRAAVRPGISRSMAQRYLKHLEYGSHPTVTLDYGDDAGRPEHRYPWAGTS
ncbi:hypothetical protein ACWC9R_36845 [Streptomyces sp. NPDC001219]